MKNVTKLFMAALMLIAVGCGEAEKKTPPSDFSVVGIWESATTRYEFTQDMKFVVSARDNSGSNGGDYKFENMVITLIHPQPLSPQNFEVLEPAKASMKLKNQNKGNIIELTRVQ